MNLLVYYYHRLLKPQFNVEKLKVYYYFFYFFMPWLHQELQFVTVYICQAGI